MPLIPIFPEMDEVTPISLGGTNATTQVDAVRNLTRDLEVLSATSQILDSDTIPLVNMANVVSLMPSEDSTTGKSASELAEVVNVPLSLLRSYMQDGVLLKSGGEMTGSITFNKSGGYLFQMGGNTDIARTIDTSGGQHFQIGLNTDGTAAIWFSHSRSDRAEDKRIFITGVKTPTLNSDAANKEYVDTFLSKSGGTMTGAIGMGENKITNLGTPSSSTDAATYGSIDTKLKGLIPQCYSRTSDYIGSPSIAYSSSNRGVQGSTCTMTWTAKNTVRVTFDAQSSSESTSYDYLLISHYDSSEGTTTQLCKLGGTESSTSNVTHIDVTLDASDTLTFTYRKDNSVDGGIDIGVIFNIWISYGSNTSAFAAMRAETDTQFTSYFTLSQGTPGFIPCAVVPYIYFFNNQIQFYTTYVPIAGGGSSSSVNLASGVTGILPTENGGTGTRTGTAPYATQLETSRNIRTSLSSTSSVPFNGTADITPGVTGTLAVSNGGTGKTSVGDTSYTTYNYRGCAIVSSTPSSMTNGTVAFVYS